MTGGQLANGVGSALVMVTSGSYILLWTLYGGWFRSRIGRFVILKATAIFFTGIITVALTLSGFNQDVDWLRYIQAILWVMVSIAFIHHTRAVWKVNHRKEKIDD